MIAYRPTDRLRYKIGGAEFVLSPLTYDQKSKIQIELSKGGDSVRCGIALAIRTSIKGLKGIKTADGKDLEAEFDENGLLDEDIFNALANLASFEDLQMICTDLVTEINTGGFVDPINGNIMENVKFLGVEDEKKIS